MDNTQNKEFRGLSGQVRGQPEVVKVKYCLYARKSTESEEQQVLSIDSQIKEMLAMAERDNLEVIEIKKESHSAKEAGARPIFNEIIEEIKQGKFNGILTWAPDRISRNAGDLGRIVDLMDQGILIDSHRAPIIKKMFEKVAYEKFSGRRLHAWLKDEIKFKTKNGKPLTVSNIYIILRNTFYYGSIEYPRGGGQWYQGKHTPIITKELFDKVQESLSEHIIRTQGKEFAFTKLMTCSLCGSGITADEKWKKQKNGNIHRYVYYGCCRFHDKFCKSGWMNEDDLIEQLSSLMDQIDLDEIGIKEKIRSEIERHRKFQSGLLGIKEKSGNGPPSRSRTYDPLLKRELLYQLSYGRIFMKLT